jgi:hypothetical protein
MKLENIFDKPVDRRIEGVIKADDHAGLLHELEEYVITDEVEKHLGTFLEAYRNARNDNGVWISGFFGSGKSHLLKMLALLIENREVGGERALDIFTEKLKGDEFLRAELERAAAIPSKSILFNIDQKADVITKTEIDALLAVFQKVFDESCGYYGKQGYVAQFERHLDENGDFGAFKSSFEKVAGKAWEHGREQHILERGSIAKAYADVAGGSEVEAADVLKRYSESYKVSIEDFAEQINRYLETRGKDFRLNFFVDEVGQYIAENTKLMTNLQTVAESLSTKCRGKAWIIVTAQQQMSEIVGDMTKRQSLDYSKIMARFATRMPLTSSNVSEVIQKRLLKKKDEATEPVGKLFDNYQNDMRTLFSFSDNSIQLKGYRDREHFIASYPFLPYQYDLFQLAIKELSDHNAFEGRHASVGERSMLGVFQQVAKNIMDLELGAVAPFDLMYEGIRSALKASVQTSIQTAEKNLDNDLAKRVFKVLFLVKYVKQFKPALENICVLVRTRFDGDAAKLSRDVEVALGLLEQQTYIQRNGSLYEFLTDEEKDVEDEIKNTEIDSTEIVKSLDDFLFGIGIRTSKVRHEATGGDYPFARKIDDQLTGRQNELEINIITPYNSDGDSVERFRMQTLNSNELCVVLPADPRFIQDLGQFKKTERYVRQAASQQHQPILQRIIGDKREQIGQRERSLELQAKRLLSEARLFARGQELDVSGEDPQTRITRAFNTLIDKVYTNLSQLKGITYTDGHISEALNKSDDGLFGSDGAGIPEAEQNVLNQIRMTKDQALRSTVKSVVEHFEKAPFGWPRVAILTQLASLYSRGRLDAKKDSLSLSAGDLGKALRNTQEYANVVLELQVEFTQGQISSVRTFYKEFFDTLPKASEARALAEQTLDDLRREADQLRTLGHSSSRYPFSEKLEPVAQQISEVAELGVNGLFAKLAEKQDTLLDSKEDITDPIKRFIKGDKGRIFDEAHGFLQKQNTNLEYLPDVSGEAIKSILNDPECYHGDSMRKLRREIDALEAKVEKGLDAAREKARDELGELKAYLTNIEGHDAVSTDIEAGFAEAATTLKNAEAIPLIEHAVELFKRNEYPALLARVEGGHSGDGPNKVKQPGAAGFDHTGSDNPDQLKAKPLTPISSLKPANTKPVLSSENDIDKYLEELRAKLLQELRSGNRIAL